jgi:hypothetical protein
LCVCGFDGVIFEDITDEEVDKWFPNGEECKTYDDKKFIDKVWDGCVQWGYISEEYDILGRFLDEIEIE